MDCGKDGVKVTKRRELVHNVDDAVAILLNYLLQLLLSLFSIRREFSIWEHISFSIWGSEYLNSWGSPWEVLRMGVLTTKAYAIWHELAMEARVIWRQTVCVYSLSNKHDNSIPVNLGKQLTVNWPVSNTDCDFTWASFGIFLKKYSTNEITFL